MPRLAGLPSTGKDAFSAENGSGSTPRHGAGSIATDGDGETAAGDDLREQATERVPDHDRLAVELPDHLGDVVRDLTDALLAKTSGLAWAAA